MKEKLLENEELLDSLEKIADPSRKKKAVALLSGGLDSTIATRLIKDMGIEITALNFHTAFCTCSQKGCKFESRQVANEFDLPLKVMSVTKEYMEIVRNPKFGYGKGMNPCIDCRVFMFKKAKEYMEEIGGSFVITGEVLGQRPMSQTKRNMSLIEKESGLEGRILRPLSANKKDNLDQEVLDEVNIEALPNITGRSRKEQYALADELNIENYSCPSGGCLLTDKEFSIRLKDYFKYNAKDDINEIKLLKTGRHFRLNDHCKVVVARDESESKKLGFYKHVGVLMEPIEQGPDALILSDELNHRDIELASKIVARYCKGDKIHLKYKEEEKEKIITVSPFTADELEPYWVQEVLYP
ncbi:MAG TPA: hypothetical protein ENI73_00400 [Spirochaetes bacterium]|mgnify:CR=1 FL=1|nr:hypothetical protein [Spirochaetota bacterium]